MNNPLAQAMLNLAKIKLREDVRLITQHIGLWECVEYLEKNNPSADLPYHSNMHQFLVMVTALRLLDNSSHRRNELVRTSLCLAALFHDYDHSGGTETDSINIERAVKGFLDYVDGPGRVNKLPMFSKSLVEKLIRSTEFPWKVDDHLSQPLQSILRDADILASAEIAGVFMPIDGLPLELETKLGKILSPVEMADGQNQFLSNIVLNTPEGQAAWTELYPAILEVQKIYAISQESKAV